jgi:hypothetical protein
MSNSPCYKCECRSCGCHANCGDYQEWQKKHLEEKERHTALKKQYNESTTVMLRGLVGVSGIKSYSARK